MTDAEPTATPPTATPPTATPPTATPVEAQPSPRSSALGYQPALDGVRALAIALVIGFHLDVGHGSIVPGGFLGVDVFFVLSGFLITSLLIDEKARTGSISLRRFWARRVARLAPLLLVLVLVGVFVRWVHPIGGLQAPTALGFLAIFGYVGNWVAATGHQSLGSFEFVWSLAVEEQFYLVWPLLLLGLAALRLGRPAGAASDPSTPPAAADRLPRRVAGVSLVGAGAAITARTVWWLTTLAWNAHDGFMLVAVGQHRVDHWNAWFFSTGLRCDGLLVGAALAATRARWEPALRSRRRSGVVGAVAVVAVGLVVATSSIYDKAVPEWSLAVLVLAVAALTASAVAAPSNLVAMVLAWAPLVWLGKRSYAAYLIHLPVFLVIDARLSGESRDARAAVAVAITLVAADGAHRLVERPAQRRVRRLLHAG